MVVDLVFYIGVALLFAHELDAVQRHEWRIFPFVCRLKDDVGYKVFVLLHIPLFVSVLWLIGNSSKSVNYWFQVIFDLFFIVHMGLHILLRKHEKYEFTSVTSKSIIVLVAAVGLVHLFFLSMQNIV